MGQIYISAETRKKLEGSAASRNNKLLLDKFDPNRIIKANSAPRKPTTPPAEKDKPSSAVRKITDEEWEKIKANANRLGDKAEIERRLKEKRQQAALVQKYGVSKNQPQKRKRHKAPSIGGKKITPAKKKKNPYRLRDDYSKPLHGAGDSDYYDFAGEYISRGVEYGHGRKKSKEWQGAHISGTGGSIGRMQSIRRNDPNVFDRQAMK